MATLKSNPQVFTPKNLVEKMLDVAEYLYGNIIGNALLENSFGDGAFLKEVVTRYINEARNLV